MRRRELVRSLAGSWLAATGCKRRRAKDERKLKVAVAPQLTMAPLHLALEMGYFADAGVDVSVVEITNSVQVMLLLAAGEVDASLTSLSVAFLNAVARGSNVRIVAGRALLSAGCESGDRIYVRRADHPGGLQDLRLLRGKRIAISRRGTTTEFFLDAMLASAGLTQRDVQVSTLARSEAVAALLSGRIDVLMDHQFHRDMEEVSRQVARGPRVADFLPNFQYTHVFFGSRLLAGDFQKGIGLLGGYLRGVREFMAGQTPRFMDDFARANGLDPARTRAGCRDFLAPDGGIQTADLERFLSGANEKGYLTAALHAADLIDWRFLTPAQRLAAGQEPTS